MINFSQFSLATTETTFYEVFIETQGSLSIGSTITLHCNVTPRPHSPVTYTWRTTAAGRISYNTASPNATVVIRSYHAKYGHYYCTVKQTGAIIGTGVARLEIDSNIFSLLKYMIVTGIILTHCRYPTASGTCTTDGYYWFRCHSESECH